MGASIPTMPCPECRERNAADPAWWCPDCHDTGRVTPPPLTPEQVAALPEGAALAFWLPGEPLEVADA